MKELPLEELSTKDLCGKIYDLERQLDLAVSRLNDPEEYLSQGRGWHKQNKHRKLICDSLKDLREELYKRVLV